MPTRNLIDGKPRLRSRWWLIALAILVAPGCSDSTETTTSAPDTTRLDEAFTTTSPVTTTIGAPPPTIAQAFQRLSEMGTLRALTAEVTDGHCRPIDSVNIGEPAPIGSIFELYVLAALGEAVVSGDVAWDDGIVIRDELRSVPAGVLQEMSRGEVVTIREMAELMISDSDNTATDHLIAMLGRETVESVMVSYGNSSMDLNTPLLDTRELSALKVGPASGLRISWLNSNEEERRAILDQISDITPGDIPVRDWVDPVDPHLLQWFATPEDLCNLAIGLDSLASSVPEVGDILMANSGVPPEAGTWERVWFKGGAEPGMVATWWMTGVDGRTFLTAGSVVDPDEPIESEEASLLFAAIRDLLAP
ncbi:MAG TPA: serine hydrolase [Acidimicrobiia bacterium]|nr:serine hydrolase [Acidimicrobiia bacterium]